MITSRIIKTYILDLVIKYKNNFVMQAELRLVTYIIIVAQSYLLFMNIFLRIMAKIHVSRYTNLLCFVKFIHTMYL